jgi:tetratricopeptide (TPR) repeat protein
MEEKLTNEFPLLKTARACCTQKQYTFAADIYSEIIESAEEVYGKESEEIFFLYVEYCHALVSEVHVRNIDTMNKLMNKQTVTVENEDMLEIAWTLLELCRIYYEKTDNKEKLNKVHFLLGEVCLNNDRVEDALSEYCLCDEEDVDVLNNKAFCLEFLKRYDECVDTLKKIDLSKYPELKEEIQNKIEVTRERQNRPIEIIQKTKAESPAFSEEEKVIDINKLIRRKR